MKTVRFSQVVKRGGAPETYLVLTKPAQDTTLQAAIKAHRVMTVFQENVGTKTDAGKVGFEQGSARQYLLFPKTIKAFEGRKVIGIKYDLLSSAEVPKSKRAQPPKPPKPPKKRAPKPRPPRLTKKEAVPPKVIEFPTLKREKPGEKTDLREIRRLARQAIQALEKGKQIVAFNLLKRIATA